MSASTCPELETLFLALEDGEPFALEHLESCERCAGIFEEHRLLEHALSHVMDPPPPGDFVQQVMAKVAVAPAPARRELAVAAGILGTALAALIILLVASIPSLEALPLRAMSRAVNGGRWMEAAFEGARTVWSMLGPQLLVACVVTFLCSLYGLRRLAGGPSGLEA